MKFFFMLLLPMQLLAQQRPIIFKNVTIIDVIKGTAKKHQHLLIEGQRIKNISTKAITDPSAVVIDATGKFIIPDLCDFNAEVLNYEHKGPPAFNLLLANGVASVRDLKPEETLKEVFAFRNNLLNEIALASRIYLSGKTLVDRLPFQHEKYGKITTSNYSIGSGKSF